MSSGVCHVERVIGLSGWRDHAWRAEMVRLRVGFVDGIRIGKDVVGWVVMESCIMDCNSVLHVWCLE